MLCVRWNLVLCVISRCLEQRKHWKQHIQAVLQQTIIFFPITPVLLETPPSVVPLRLCMHSTHITDLHTPGHGELPGPRPPPHTPGPVLRETCASPISKHCDGRATEISCLSCLDNNSSVKRGGGGTLVLSTHWTIITFSRCRLHFWAFWRINNRTIAEKKSECCNFSVFLI